MQTVYPEKQIESQIGFDFVRDFIAQHCHSNLALEKVMNLKPFGLVKKLNERFTEVQEYIQLKNASDKNIPFARIEPLPVDLHKCKIEGYYLTLNDLVVVQDFVELATTIFTIMNHQIDGIPSLVRYTSDAIHLKEIKKKLGLLLKPDGSINEQANPVLKKLFKSKFSQEKQVISALNSVFSILKKKKLVIEAEPTVRNGRYVIPVPSAIRKQVEGVLQGESGTKSISFIEPIEVIQANNELNNIHFEIDQEIIRLMIKVSGLIGKHVKALYHAEEQVSFLDFLNAISIYASQFKAIIPSINKNDEINLKGCRHPKLVQALGKAKMVLLDFEFSKENRLMIISGPNAGGKSVALKTFTLAQYSIQCGLPICADQSSTTFLFENLLTDIGDNQNMDSDLSTYSAHLTAMAEFLKPKTGKSFIAVDEIGAGTDPQLGGPMAEAMIADFNKKGHFGIITTHFSNLKSLSTDMHYVFNASMLYDTDKLKPLFNLLIGNPGSSFVFELAKRIDIPSAIIKNAKSLAGENKQQLEQYLTEMDVKKSQLHKAQIAINEKNNQFDRLINEYDTLKSNLVKSKNEIIIKAKNEASAIISDANKRVEKTIKQIKETKAEKRVVAQEREKLAHKHKELTKDKAEISALKVEIKPIVKRATLKVGDFASIDNETQAVEIVKVMNGKAQVVFDSVRTTVALSRLYPIEKEHQHKSKSNITQVLMSKMDQFKPKLDLRGLTEAEASFELLNHLDNAYALGVRQVSIYMAEVQEY